MHPEIGQRLAAEHIKAMTAAAGKARPARQAHRARIDDTRTPALPTDLPLTRQRGVGARYSRTN